MSLQKCKGKRMNATQLLSFQSNLYAQNDLKPLPALPLPPRRKGSVNNKCKEQETISSIVKGFRGDEKIFSDKNCGNRSPSIKRCLNKRRGKGNGPQSEQVVVAQETENIVEKRETASTMTHCLPIWACAMPGWTVTPIARLEKPVERCLSTKVKNIKLRNEGEVKADYLAPLRFSTKHGLTAWRFVLPSPDFNKVEKCTPNDLPYWCKGNNEEITVDLGPKQLRVNCKSSTSSISTAEQTSSDEEETDEDCLIYEKTTCQNHTQLSCQSRSVYAEPNFSAAAPSPCQLPFPSFLARR